MAKPQPGTWHADPAHLAHPSRFDPRRLFEGLGLTLGSVLKLEAAARDDDRAQTIKSKATSVIHIYLQGGFPHMDSFDPKPDAPDWSTGHPGFNRDQVQAPGRAFQLPP